MKSDTEATQLLTYFFNRAPKGSHVVLTCMRQTLNFEVDLYRGNNATRFLTEASLYGKYNYELSIFYHYGHTQSETPFFSYSVSLEELDIINKIPILNKYNYVILSGSTAQLFYCTKNNIKAKYYVEKMRPLKELFSTVLPKERMMYESGFFLADGVNAEFKHVLFYR